MIPVGLIGHERPVTCLKFNRDGDLLFSSCKAGIVGMYNVATARRIGTYVRDKSELEEGVKATTAVNTFDITHDSKIIAVGESDCFIQVYDVQTGVRVSMMEVKGPVHCIEFNRGAKNNGLQNRLAVASSTFARKDYKEAVVGVFAWDHKTKKIKETADPALECLDNGLEPPKQIAWGPNDATLITTHDGNTPELVVWDSFSGELLQRFQPHKERITSLSFDPLRLFCMTTSRDCTAKLFSAKKGIEEVLTIRTDRPLNTGALHPAFCERYRAALDRDGIILGAEELDIGMPHVRSHALLGGGQDAKDVTTTGATSGKFETQLWNVPLGIHLGEISGHIGPVRVSAWRPDGKAFVTGGEGSLIWYHAVDRDYLEDIKRYP